MDSDEAFLDPDNIPDIETILIVCAGLMIVDKVNNIIRLIHYTLQEYFEVNREIWLASAQHLMFETCTAFLRNYHKPPNNIREASELAYESKVDYPWRLPPTMPKNKIAVVTSSLRGHLHFIFLNYATRFWRHHARFGQVRGGKIMAFVEYTGATRVSALFVFDKGFIKKDSIPANRIHALHLAAFFALDHAIEALLSLSSIIDAPNYHGWTALHIVTNENRESAVEILLKNNTCTTKR